jgi:hypothetical protein
LQSYLLFLDSKKDLGKKGRHPVLKYRVSHGSQPSPDWVDSRSPLGWWLGLHQPPLSFGFDSQTRGTWENRAPPCVKVPGSSRVPPREQLYNRYCSNKDTPTTHCTRVQSFATVTLEFWVRFPNERNQGKQAHPVLKYRVPHCGGSHRLVFSRSTCPPLSPSSLTRTAL